MFVYRGGACQIEVVSQQAVPHAGTLMPRLEAAAVLAGLIQGETGRRCAQLGRANGGMDCAAGAAGGRLLDAEHLAHQATAAMDCVRARIARIRRLPGVPAVLAPAVPVVRTLSSDLFGPAPACSHRLCELATGLGSIVMDAAVLTGASLDLGSVAAESNRLLYEAKLTADSKMRQSYPDVWGTQTGMDCT